MSNATGDVLYVVVPAYNEADNIEALVEDWYPIVESHPGNGRSRLVVIDDGSTDDTYRRLLWLSKSRPMLEPMSKPNSGHGPTLIYGYKHAVAEGANYVFQTDSDRQTLPLEFEGFWSEREGVDAIFGVRLHRQDGWKRKVVERVLCLILQAIFGVSVPDANAPFRLMSASFVKRHIRRLPDDFNLPNAMLVVYGMCLGDKVSFREVTFRPRQGGKNSINIRRIVRIGLNAIGDFRHLRKELDT